MNWPTNGDHGPLGDGFHASASVRPTTSADLAQALTDHAARELAVYPQGGRTALGYGDLPARPGVALDTTALDRVVDYPAADMTITVQAGMTLGRLQEILAEHRQRLPLDPPNATTATLGGIFATAASGPRRYGHGHPRDLIIGVSFALPDGRLAKGGGRVVKNVAGYDLPKLMTGDLGTLGVITEMTLKVRPIPESSALVFAGVSDLHALSRLLDAIPGGATRPVAIEALNTPAAAAIDSERRLGLIGQEWVVVLGFEDNRDAVAWQTRTITEDLRLEPIACVLDDQAAPYWDALANLAAPRPDRPLGLAARVRPSSMTGILSGLPRDAWMVQAHAGQGVVLAQAQADVPREQLFETVQALRLQAAESDGSVVLTHCPPDWKPGFGVWGPLRPDWVLMRHIKEAFDPDNLLNPGRFVGTI